MKKVLVIEDQTILCEMICNLLKTSYPAIELVGSTGDGQEAYNLCLKHKPDFLMLDMMLPNLHGIEILERLKKDKQSVRVLIFSALPAPDIIKKALELGVDGFIEKNVPLDVLKTAIENVISGQSYFSPKVVEIMRDLMINQDRNGALDSLTSREREIVKLVAESFSNKEIAEKLHISPKTAETHRANIMKKLSLHDAAGITRFAISHGLTEIFKQ